MSGIDMKITFEEDHGDFFVTKDRRLGRLEQWGRDTWKFNPIQTHPTWYTASELRQIADKIEEISKHHEK